MVLTGLLPLCDCVLLRNYLHFVSCTIFCAKNHLVVVKKFVLRDVVLAVHSVSVISGSECACEPNIMSTLPRSLVKDDKLRPRGRTFT